MPVLSAATGAFELCIPTGTINERPLCHAPQVAVNEEVDPALMVARLQQDNADLRAELKCAVLVVLCSPVLVVTLSKNELSPFFLSEPRVITAWVGRLKPSWMSALFSGLAGCGHAWNVNKGIRLVLGVIFIADLCITRCDAHASIMVGSLRGPECNFCGDC